MSRPAWAEIDLEALRHNLQIVRRAAPSSQIASVIKANAYGHGIIRVAKALRDTDAFGVASIDEAMQLREAGIENRILLLEGMFDAEELALVKKFNFDLVVHNLSQVEQLKNADHLLSVWIKLETGMNRLGLSPDDFSRAVKMLNANKNIKKPLILMTHLANADDTSDQFTSRQIEDFFLAVKDITEFEFETSIANSAGVLVWPESHTDSAHLNWVRPGIMLYGISPVINSKANDFDLKPVMTVKSRLIDIRNCEKGARVGYGGTWVSDKDRKIGVVAFGYGDGYPRHAGNSTPVLVNQKRAAIVGRVSMDLMTVDLSGHQNVQIGDVVELWGKNLPVEEIAHAASTIAYELVCGITKRVKIIEL